MLYIIYGSDSEKTRSKLHELLELARKKRPEAELFLLNTENWSETQFDELLISRGLFEQKYTVVLDKLFEKKDVKEYIIDRAEEMKSSEQIFLMLEGAIDAASLKKLSKNAEKIQEFVKKEDKKQSYNIFSITNGLLEKDKKNLWIDYLTFLNMGAAPEEIHGILFWQVKNMILASCAGNQTETGLSPFVYKNALTGSRKYKTEELENLSSELVQMTHKVRSGEGELDIMLEKWILSV